MGRRSEVRRTIEARGVQNLIRNKEVIMKTLGVVCSRKGSARIFTRQERPEAYYVEVEKEGRTTVHTWPAVGPAAVSPEELLLRYRDEFGLGY